MVTILKQCNEWLPCIFIVVMLLELTKGNSDSCNNILDIENATPRGNATSPFAVGTVIKYNCNPGFEATIGTVSATCKLEEGSAIWVASDSRCRHKSCGHPGEVENAKRIGEDFRFGKSVKYECFSGYEIIGVAQIFCDAAGDWTRRPPTCRIISCRDPPQPVNGSVQFNSVTYQSIATYSCHKSFRFVGTTDDTITRHCLADKTWNGSLPLCEEVLCPDPHTDSEVEIIDISQEKNRYPVGKAIYYKCQNEQTTIRIECTRRGVWSVKPQCVVTPDGKTKATEAPLPPTAPPLPSSSTESDDAISPCGKPPHVEHGTVTYTQPQTAIYKCESGFQLKGPAMLTCLPSRKWDGEPPSCEKTSPTPIGLIVGIVIAVIVVIGGTIGGIVLFQKKKKSSVPGKIKKASPNDAVNMDEVQSLEKNNKPVPVTVL